MRTSARALAGTHRRRGRAPAVGRGVVARASAVYRRARDAERRPLHRPGHARGDRRDRRRRRTCTPRAPGAVAVFRHRSNTYSVQRQKRVDIGRARRNASPCTRSTMANASSAIARDGSGDGSFSEPQVEHRPHVQVAHRRWRTRCCGCRASENVRCFRRVLSQVLKGDPQLHEGDRFPFLLHRHHDVEAGGAHLGDRGLQFCIEHLDHDAGFARRICPSRSRRSPISSPSRIKWRMFSLPARPRRIRRTGSPRGCRAPPRRWSWNIAISRENPSMVVDELDPRLARA